MPDYFYIDFETCSPTDLPTRGAMRYAKHPETDILMMAFAYNNNEPSLWLPPEPPPTLPSKAVLIAHNMGMFDYLIWNEVGVNKYGLPPIELEQCEDTMAIAARFGLPQTLEKLAEALGIPIQKRWDGMKLIRKFSIPPYEPHTGNDWKKFCHYCVQDINVLRAIHRKLPARKLSKSEKRHWLNTMQINHNGVPVDTQSIVTIHNAITRAREHQLKKVPEITGGAVKSVFQVAKIKEFCKSYGVELENLQAATVAKVLSRDYLPNSVELLLELRAAHGVSSVSKYERMVQRVFNGRIYDGLRYYGAGTGRFSGVGVQWQNFPRNIAPDPEALIEEFANIDLNDIRLILKAKTLLRSMIKTNAPRQLLVADYKSIEYILLCWFAGEEEAVERFRNGFDPYKDMASHMWKIDYDDVSKMQRQVGKAVVLGSGYVLGAKGLQKYAQNYGINMSFDEAKKYINQYRTKYHRIQKTWYALYDAAVRTVQTNRPHEYRDVKFNIVKTRGLKWLQMTLPSGRAIYYNSPHLSIDKYDNPVIKNKGIIPGTKKYGIVYFNISRCIENVIQGLARDLLVYHIDVLLREQFRVINSVHDETHIELLKGDNADLALDILQTPPKWAPDLPVMVEYAIGERYSKP